jgi:hypothetical protein
MRALKTICFLTCCLIFPRAGAAAPASDPCELPQDLQREVASKYPGATIVRLSDLEGDYRGNFQKDHGDACPGLVSVDFYGDRNPTVAMVLIAGSGPTEEAELVVARRVAGRWKTTLFDTAKSSVPVVWSQPSGKYDDVYGNKTIRATRSVIVFSGYASWTIVYAWKGDHVSKVWLRD